VDRTYDTFGEKKRYRRVWLGNMKEIHYLQTFRRWEIIIKMYRKEIGWEGLGLSG
jgi:hypothetical protein